VARQTSKLRKQQKFKKDPEILKEQRKYLAVIESKREAEQKTIRN